MPPVFASRAAGKGANLKAFRTRRTYELALVALVAVVFTLVAVDQLRSLDSANGHAAGIQDDRATVEELGRAVDRIENAVWQSWATTDEIFIDDETLAFGVDTSRETATFYGERVEMGSPAEAQVAREMLALTSRGEELLLAAREGVRGEEGSRLAAQVAAFSIERAALREQWLVENSATQDRADSAVRRHTNALIALLVGGLIALTVGGIALKLRMRRDRDQAMRQLRRTAEEMASLASTDPLTGLGNQRQFYARLDIELRRSLEADEPVSLALIDVDNFKLVNDEHGHLIGDQVLLEVARRIEANAAPHAAITARVGGEEFAVVMPGSCASSARDVAEIIRQAMEKPIVPVGTVTVSIGLTDAQPGDDVVTLFKRCDTALYRAKREGKNRVVAADDVIVDPRERARSEIAASPETFAALKSLVTSVDDSQSIHGHSDRVARFAASLARMAGWSPQDVARLRQAALLHDVGKVVVPPGILSKPSGLTDGERSLVSVHPAVGSEMVRRALDPEQASWVLHHHERWDGAGYPDGLAGEEIPEGARILAIADAWDAMTSERVYAPALAATEAMAELRACRGTQFWPRGVDFVVEVAAEGAAEKTLV